MSPIKGNVFCVSIILLYLSNKTSLNENRSRVEQNSYNRLKTYFN